MCFVSVVPLSVSAHTLEINTFLKYDTTSVSRKFLVNVINGRGDITAFLLMREEIQCHLSELLGDGAEK